MAGVNKVLYVVVVDDGDDKKEKDGVGKESFRYTRPVLQSTLQLMGCKARHAFKISKRVFEIVKTRSSNDSAARVDIVGADMSCTGSKLEDSFSEDNFLMKAQVSANIPTEVDPGRRCQSTESYKRDTTVTIVREEFLDVVCDALSEYKYVGPKQREDLILACRVMNQS